MPFSIPDEAHLSRGAGITVLVADSQLLFAETLAISLGLNEGLIALDDFPVTSSAAGNAVRTLRPDVVLVDYWLAGGGGPATAQAIAAESSHTKVLLLSWEISANYVATALESGAVGFLPKSLPLPKVAEAVRRAHAGEPLVYADELKDMLDRLDRNSRRAGELAEQLAQLTPRQLQVLSLLGAGLPIEEVAHQMGITKGTVTLHINKILARTRVESQAEAIALGREAGIIGPAASLGNYRKPLRKGEFNPNSE